MAKSSAEVIICICEGKEDWMKSCGDIQSKLFQRCFFLATQTGRATFYFYVGSMTILLLPAGAASESNIITTVGCLAMLEAFRIQISKAHAKVMAGFIWTLIYIILGSCLCISASQVVLNAHEPHDLFLTTRWVFI